MDRRTLMAFALLTLVLILYQYLAPKPPARVPRVAPPDSAQTLNSSSHTPLGGGQAEDSTRIDSIRRSTAGSFVEGQLENTLIPADTLQRPLTIRSERYEAILDPQGGRITSWRLASYTDAKEQTADLVARPSAGMFQLHLVTPKGDVDLSQTPFLLQDTGTPTEPSARLLARDASGATIQIDYKFPRDRYSTRMQIRVEGLPDLGRESYLKLVFPAGIAFVERDPKFDQNSAAAVALLGRRYVKHLMRRGQGGWQEQESGIVQWAGTRSKYFLLAAIPEGSPEGEVLLSRPKGERTLVTALQIPLPLEGLVERSFEIYAGPMAYRELESYGVGLEKAIDMGWKVIVPFSKLLRSFFGAVHRVVPNYGVVILILSVLTKVLFYPLTKKSMESMKQMQLLKPEMDRINEKFKNDPQRRNAAMLELYKKYKVNPVGGCLPIVIQMPVFIALYNVLNTSIELRKAPFFLWIDDLSAPDKVGEVLGFPIHILPLVMAATMLWQQKLTPTDPRQAAMAYLMPIMMTVFFYPMPSGLVFYWTVNNLMSVAQQMWMNRATTHQLVAAS